MIASLRGVYLTADDATYLADVLDHVCRTAQPSARLADAARRLRKTVDRLASAQANRKGGVTFELESGQAAPYDLVDTGEAARILGITPAGVRYLADKGRLPAHRAGGRWLYPALAVVERAERQAARRVG